MIYDETFWCKLIQEALASKAEYAFLDFKLTLSEKNERLKEHINAFGNLEKGGCFVFGVKDYSPVGVLEEWDAIITRVTHLAMQAQEPALNVEAFPLDIYGKQLLCIHVLPSISKPVFIKDRAPLGGKACYKRTGSSTVAMSVAEIRNFLLSDSKHYFDESIVSDASVDQLDFKELSKLIPEINTQNTLSEKNVALLVDRGILAKGKLAPEITVAAWLCFSENPQESRMFRNMFIELQVFRGVARDEPIKKYDIKGSLPHQIELAIQLLAQYIWVVPKLKGVKRVDVPAYSESALREVVTNSVVHRDYMCKHQPVKINVFSNRIEIENPGSLMPGLTVHNLIHRRDWRNPLLAGFMKRFGFGEMDGQGIDRLYAAVLEIKVPPPVFISHPSSFVVTLSAPKQFEEFTPEEKRLMVVVMITMNETIGNESVRKCFDISSEKAGTLLKAMVAEGVLQTNTKSRKYAKYVLTEEYREKIFG